MTSGTDDQSSSDSDEDARATQASSLPGSLGSAIAVVEEDDEDELPWQVIALLDTEMLQQLLWSSRYRKKKVAKAQEGKGLDEQKLLPGSLHAAAKAGSWLWRVVAPLGVALREGPSLDDQQAGSRRSGEYVCGLRLGSGGDWLQLQASEDDSAGGAPSPPHTFPLEMHQVGMSQCLACPLPHAIRSVTSRGCCLRP